MKKTLILNVRYSQFQEEVHCRDIEGRNKGNLQTKHRWEHQKHNRQKLKTVVVKVRQGVIHACQKPTEITFISYLVMVTDHKTGLSLLYCCCTFEIWLILVGDE